VKGSLTAPVAVKTEPDAQALIEEARRRQRRRRRWFGVTVLAVGLAVVVPLAVSGGSKKPPTIRSHNSGGNNSAAVKKTRANSLPPAPPSVVVLQAGRLGANSGWASNVSDLFVTWDKGATWRRLTLPPLIAHLDLADRIQSVVAKGPNDLWLAVGDIIGLVPFRQSVDGSDRGEAIFRSTDGGTTWSASTLPGCLQTCGAGLSLSFVDAQHGFATDGPDPTTHTRVFSTDDGGTTWRQVSVIPKVSFGAEIAFTTTTDGWLLTGPIFNQSGTVASSPSYGLLHTTDGGVTWNQPANLPSAGQYELPAFFGPEDGAVMEWSPTPTVFSTSDGGTTWSAHSIPVGNPQALPNGPLPFSAADASTWVALTRVSLVETTDRGMHWTKVMTDVGGEKGVKPLVFFSATDGWTATAQPGCVEPNGCLPALLSTHNGGQTWTVLSP